MEDPEMNKLHPGIRWYWRIRSLVILIFFFPMFFFSLLVIPIAGIILFLVGLVIMELYARLSYNNWGYKFTSTEFRKEYGIIFKKYSSVPYSRIQNVSITRGLFARIFNYSTVNIHTAGYSGVATPEGMILAIDPKKAEKIRDYLMHQVSRTNTSRQEI